MFFKNPGPSGQLQMAQMPGQVQMMRGVHVTVYLGEDVQLAHDVLQRAGPATGARSRAPGSGSASTPDFCPCLAGRGDPLLAEDDERKENPLVLREH